MVYSNKYKFRKLRGTVQDSINEERARQNEDFNRKLKNAEDSMRAIYPEEYKKIRSRYFGNGNNLGLIGSQYNYIHDMITRNSDDQMKKYYNELNDYFIKQTGTQPGYMLPGVDVVDDAPDFNALRQKDIDRFYSPTENSDYLNSVEKQNARNAYLALQNKNADSTFDHDGYFDYDPNNGLLNTEANYARATGSYNYTPEEREAAATWERAQNSPIVTAMEFSPLFPVVAGVKSVAAANAPQASGVDVAMNAAFAALPAIGAGAKAINNTRKLIRKPPQITRLALNSDDRFIQGQNLSRSLDKTSIAPNVDAHGISKGNELERLEAILSEGIDKNKKFFSAPLAKAEGVDNIGQALGTSGGTAYTDGMFILASKPNKYLIDDGIDAVLINTADTKYAKELKKYLTHKYPNTKFLTYEEAPKYYGAKWNPIEEIKNTDNAEKLSQPIQYGSVGDELPPPPDEINYFFKSGGIHINPKNEGKFTDAANRAGMGVQEYARHILANKENYSPTMVKRANFARNASKWKHADGGDVPPFKSFDDWYRSIYHNATDTTDYNLRRAYELAPIGELEAWRSDPDKNHLHTGYWNGDVYEFMKKRNHPTLKNELDWYNSKDGANFRMRYSLDTTGDTYRYVPRYGLIFKNGGYTIGDRNRGNERQRNEFDQMSSSRRAASPENEEVVNVDNAHEWKRIHWGEYDKAPTGNKYYGDVYTINRPESYNTRKERLDLRHRIKDEFGQNTIIYQNRPLIKKYLFGENRGKYKPLNVTGFRVPDGKWIDENTRLEFPKIEYTIPEIASLPISMPTVDIDRIKTIEERREAAKREYEAEEAKKHTTQNQYQQIPKVEIQQDIKEFLDNYYNNNINNFLTEFEDEYKNQNKYNITGDTRDYFENRGGHPNINRAIPKDDTLVQNFSNDTNKKASFEINNTQKNKLIRSYHYNNDNTLDRSFLYTPYGTPVNYYFDMDFKYPQHIQSQKDLLNEIQNKFKNNTSDLEKVVDNYLSNKYFEYIKDKSRGFKTVPFQRVSSPKESKIYFPLETITTKQFEIPGIVKTEKYKASNEPEFIKKRVKSLDANGDVVIHEKKVRNPNYKEPTRETTGYKFGNTNFSYETYGDVDFNNNIDALFKNTTYYPQEVENSSEATKLKKAYGVNSLDKARKINTLLRARIFNKENGIFTTPENVDSVINKMSDQELKDMFNGISIPGFNPNNMNMKEIRKYLIFLASNNSDGDVNYAKYGGVLDATYREHINRIMQPSYKVRIIEP